MTPLGLAFLAWLVAFLLGMAATILMLLFRHPGTKIFEPGVSTLTILRDPKRYVRDPYARIVQILSIAALTLGAVTIVGLVIFQVFP